MKPGEGEIERAMFGSGAALGCGKSYTVLSASLLILNRAIARASTQEALQSWNELGRDSCFPSAASARHLLLSDPK